MRIRVINLSRVAAVVRHRRQWNAVGALQFRRRPRQVQNKRRCERNHDPADADEPHGGGHFITTVAIWQYATRSGPRVDRSMSPLGQKRTFHIVRSMSALPPKADIETQSRNVRFVPKADILRCSEECRYSITSSVIAITPDGTVRPSASSRPDGRT